MAKKQPPAYLSQPSGFDFAAGDRFIASLQQSTPPEPEKPSVARRIGDVGLSLGQGALGSFKSISDFLGADNPVSGGLDDASKFLGAQKSAQSQAVTQASMDRIKEAEASGSKLDEAQAYLGMLWDQPAEMIAQGVGSFATLGVGKLAQALKLAQAAKAAGVSKDVFLASGAAKQAVEEAAKFGFKTNIGLGAVQGVGAVKGSQFEQTYENARQQGMPEEEARALAAQAQEYGGAGTMQQVLGGVLGGVASATGPIERTLLGAGKKPVQSGVMSSVAKGFGKEFATEGGQGAQERFAGNDAAVDAGVLAPERRMQGVVGQGLMEGTIGGLLGGITGPLEGQAAALDPAVNPAKEAADTIRATEKVPESGALTKAVNAGVEAKAQAVEAGGLELAPLVDGAAPEAVTPNGLELVPRPGEQAPEPVDDPVRDKILALPDGARQDALRAYAVLNRPDAAKGVLQYNRKLLDRLLAENAPPPTLGARLTDTDMGSMLGGGGMTGRADPLAGALGMNNEAQASSITNVANVAERRPPMPASDAARMLDEARNRGLDLAVAEHPAGGFVLVPPNWVTPDMAAQGEARLNETIARMQQADAAPVERAPRTRTDGVGLNLQTDPVQNYLDNLRSVNTPAARAYVRDFDAGRITPDDVQQRMQAEQGMATPAPTDILNPAGEPFKTKMAADLAAKKTPGAAVLPVVDGGFLVRPQEPANVQDVPQAPEVPQAAPVVSPLGQAPQAVGAQPAGPTAGVPTEGAGAVEAAGVTAKSPQKEPQNDTDKAQAAIENVANDTPQPQSAPVGDEQPFAPETGTLGIPRAEMPQVPTQSHGGLVKHLNAQGIEHETTMVDAAELKPTQAEFSPSKVEKAKEATGDRAVIVSSDGHIIDGHHQALAAAEEGKPVKAIVLDAPVEQALEAVKNSPSAQPQVTADAPVAKPINRSDVDAAQQQTAALIAERIDAMTAQEVQAIARRFLPAMGVAAPAGKERIKTAVTDFTKVNPVAAAAEFGVTLPADVRRALDAEMQGKVAGAGQDDVESDSATAGNADGAYAPESSGMRSQEGADDESVAPAPPAAQPEAPKLTPAEAKSLMAWEDLGQKDGVKTHALTFYESQADKDAKRGRMIVAKVSKGDRSATAWMVDGEDKTFGALAQAKKLAEEVGMAKAVADGFVEPTAAKPAAAAKPAPAAPTGATISDFGQKIGGARKDVWSGFKDDLNKVLDDDIAGQPLTKVWPAPDYQKLIDAGMNAKTVAAVRALRDEVPAKPRAAWKVKRWAEQVKTLRGLANDVMDGKITVQDMERMGANKGTSLRGMMGRIELYELVGHEKSLEGVRFAHHHYTLYKGRENVSLWVVEKDAGATAFSNWPREIAIGDTKEQALAAFKEKYAGLDLEKAVRKASFDIFSERGSNAFYVGKKIGRNYAKLEGPFNTVREAREYREKNLQALEAKLEKYKEIPRERADVNQPRVGVDMRNGQDVTPQMFGEVFGFRGVEFGNWVEQKRRQKDLNDAFDALMDMAAVLDIPPKAISLNGQLGLAFGARGSGGVNPAAAHYEPDNVVINLTKKEGAGSLGHEWWHALDNYFAKQRKVNRGSFMTTGTDVGLAARGKDYYYEGGIRQEMIDAFGAVVKAINQTAMKARASTLDGKRTKDYWTTGEEMSARAFESYLISKLQDQNASNDYLANVVSEKTWDAMAALGMENENSYPYPTAAEIPAIRAGFDHFFQTVETKETDKGVALFATASTPVAPGQGVTLQAAQQATDKVLDGLGMRGVVVPKVVHNPAAAGIPTPSGIVPTGGTSNGEVYLFTDNLHDDADVFKVVFHELFHLGLSQSVKPADYIKTMLQFMNDPLVRQHANAWKQSADGQSRIRSMPRNNWHALAVEEALADIAEEVNANNKGIGTKEMQGWVRRTIAWLADLAQSWKMPAVARKLRGMTYTQAEAFVQETMLKGRTGAPVLLPDTRFRTTAQSIASSMGDMTPDQEKAYKNVAGVKAVPTVRERMDALKANLGLKLRQGLVDQFAAIKQLDQNAYVQARMSKGTDGTLEAMLMYGKPFMRDGAPDVDVKDGGFAKVLASLKGEQDRWMMWIAAQRAEKLKAEGKENLMTDDDISALKTLNAGKMADGTARSPVYAKALQELNAYNDAMLKLAMDSGLIDKDAYDLMAGQPYVPFYRLMEEGDMKGPKFSSGLVNQKAWQKLKGGTQQLNADLLQNMLLNWSHLLQASAKNRAATATMDAAEKMAVAYKVSADTKGAVKVMRDGSAEHWMVEDPYLLDAISAIHYVPSPLMKPLAKFKQLLTWGVTVNPTFKIRNLIRDSVSAIAQSELGYNPGANVAKGWKLTAKDSQIYASMLASGGLIKFGTQENTDRLRAQVAKLGGVVLDKSGTERFFGQIKDLYDVYNEFGDRAENVNRAALYDALIKKGKTHAEAAFMARDLMDFSMGGSAPVVRFLTQTVPFLNARLVGLDKLGRAAMEDPRRFAAVTGAVALASLALLAAYSDDDDWKKREDWDRDAYWWFKVGEQAYRIPKPFEVGAIGTLAERTAELMLSDEMTGKRYMERVSHMLSGTFSFNPVPQAFKPLLDLYANKDSFTGRAIESQADQRLRPQDRYSERTPEVAKFLGGLGLPDPAQLVKGEYSALSPKQVEHLIRGYFSWVGTAAMTVSDFGLRPLAGRGERPDMRLKDVFIAGNFVENLPTGSSRYVTQMYEQSRQAEQAYASYQEAIKAGDTDKAQSIKESAGPLLRNRPAYTAATRQLAEINRMAKRIEADQAMAGAAKRARLTQLEQQRHVIAQRVSRLAAATP